MPISRGLFFRIVAVAAATLMGMTFYELAKQLVWPDIGIWQSHVVTILFSTALVSISAIFVFKKSDEMQQQIQKELEQRVGTEAMLRQSEENLRTTLNSIGDAVISTDCHGSVVHMNPVAEYLTGWQIADARGKALDLVFDIRNEDTGHKIESPVTKVLKEGRVVGLANHTELVSRDGSRRPIADSGAPIKDPHGRITGVVLVFRDQTEERLTARELQKREMALQAFADALPEPGFLLDTDMKVIAANTAFARTLNSKVDDLIGKDALALLPVETREARKKQFAEVARLKQALVFENKVNENYFTDHVCPATDQSGEVFGYALIVLNLTQQKLAEAALRDSESLMRAMIQNLPFEFWAKDLSGKYILQNPVSLKNWGQNIGKITSETGIDRRVQEKWENANRLALEGKIFQGEWEWVDPVRGLRIFYEVVGPIFEGKSVRGILGINVDVTEQRHANAARLESEERLRFALDASHMGTWSWDIQSGTIQLSEESMKIAGMKPEYFNGQVESISRIVCADDLNKLRRAIRKVFLGKSDDFSMELRFVQPGNKFHWVETRGRLNRDADGAPKRLAGLMGDINERKLNEERLIKYQQQLQSLNSRLLLVEERERRNFSQLLHDHIGQNLNYTKLRVGMLRSQTTDSETLEALNDILATIEQMNVETRTLTYELSPPLLYEIGLDAALEWLGEHFEKRYRLKCEFEGSNADDTLDIDVRVVLFQSVRELLFNVVKHAKANHTAIKSTLNNGLLTLSVMDDGVGISTTKVGTGSVSYGLFNVRERMRQIGGDLVIDSAPGQGARVSLILNLAQKNTAGAQMQNENSGNRRSQNISPGSHAAPEDQQEL